MAEQKEKPLTRDDVLRLIEQNGGTAEGLDLSGETFADGIDLSDLDLSGIILRHAVFVRAHLERTVLFVADLEGARIMDTHLEDAVLIRADLDRTFLYEAYLEGVHLHGARFSSDTHLESAHWGSYIIGEEKKGRNDQAEHIYRRLKMWYTNAGVYDVAGEFFFREMTAKRKQFWWGGYLEWMERRDRQGLPSLKHLLHPLQFEKLSKFIFPRKRKLFHWAWSMLVNLLCGYGERPLRVVASAAVVVFGLALIYFGIGTLTPNNFLNSLYYSAVSFTALGYGRWAPEPTGWVKGLGAFEAFFGVFMMALFLITFIRKMIR